MVLTECGFPESRKPCKQCNWERGKFLRVFISAVFVLVQESACFKKNQPNGPRFSAEKQVRHFFRSDMPFYLKCFRKAVWNPPSTPLCKKQCVVSASTGQASCRTKVSSCIIHSGTCDACMDMTLNSSYSTEPLCRTLNTSLWGLTGNM